MKGKLVVGNWKMNGDLVGNQALFERIAHAVPEGMDCAVCVPFPYLWQGKAALAGSRVALGAQNVSEFDDGAYTGEVSARMLREFECRFAIVGHSERRTLFGEGDDAVARKCAAALRGGVTPIVCVGESRDQRESGATEAALRRQLDALALRLDAATLARVVLAYEPLWAIGTGCTATPDHVGGVLAFVRAWLRERVADPQRVRILYGGSVKVDGARELFALRDVDGGLIGGASLIAGQFLGICEAAAAAAQDDASDFKGS